MSTVQFFKDFEGPSRRGVLVPAVEVPNNIEVGVQTNSESRGICDNLKGLNGLSHQIFYVFFFFNNRLLLFPKIFSNSRTLTSRFGYLIYYIMKQQNKIFLFSRFLTLFRTRMANPKSTGTSYICSRFLHEVNFLV
jgi:hypothetical protein